MRVRPALTISIIITKKMLQQKESIYPIDKPYNAMQNTAGSIAYVNDEGIFYIMIDDTLYAS